MKPWMGLACAMVAVVTAQGAEPTVGNTASARREGSEYTIYQGEIELPTGGTWRVVSTGDNVRQAYLTTEDAANNDEDVMGRRMAEALHAERNQMPQYALRNLYLPCQQHAQSHTNTGPSSFSNMVDSACLAFAQSHTNGRPAALTNQINNTRRALIATTIANPWQYDRHSPKVNLEGPFFFLIPNVEFAFDKFRTTVIEHEDRKPLVLELHPYLDDGMQWVLFTDGACERVLIDPALVKAYNLTILPVQKTAAATKTIVGMRLWQVLAMQKGAGHIPLVLENSATTQRVSLTWNVSHAEESGNAALAAFDRARAQCWQVMLLAGEPPMVMKTWLALANARTEEDSRPGRGRGEATSLFNVLGGRAAVEETLQLKLLSKGDHKADAPPIPVGTLTGVEVKAHPYEELLKGAPGGNLPLALVAPTNRLFVYVAWPEWTISLLNQGGDFLSRGSTVGTGSPVEYHLLGRYLGRFGMDEQWMETVLKAGLIQEMALFVPDLFFLDGTEMTVVCRLKNSLLMTPMLKLLGVAGLGADNIATVPLKNGRNAYWALHEDLLWVGTSRSELEQGLALQKTGGKDSLGQSAEFRYMLTQLPVPGSGDNSSTPSPCAWTMPPTAPWHWKCLSCR